MGPDNADARTLVVGLFTMVMKGTNAAGSCGSKSCAKQTKGTVLMAWHGDHLVNMKQSDAGEPVWRSPARTRKITPPFEDTPRGTKKGPAPKQTKPPGHLLGRVVMTPAHQHQTISSLPVVTQVFIPLRSPHLLTEKHLFFDLCQLLILTTRSSHSLTF